MAACYHPNSGRASPAGGGGEAGDVAQGAAADAPRFPPPGGSPSVSVSVCRTWPRNRSPLHQGAVGHVRQRRGQGSRRPQPPPARPAMPLPPPMLGVTTSPVGRACRQRLCHRRARLATAAAAAAAIVLCLPPLLYHPPPSLLYRRSPPICHCHRARPLPPPSATLSRPVSHKNCHHRHHHPAPPSLTTTAAGHSFPHHSNRRCRSHPAPPSAPTPTRPPVRISRAGKTSPRESRPAPPPSKTLGCQGQQWAQTHRKSTRLLSQRMEKRCHAILPARHTMLRQSDPPSVQQPTPRRRHLRQAPGPAWPQQP